MLKKLQFTVLVSAITLLIGGPVSAVVVSQSFEADEPLAAGTIVSLDSSSNKVSPATSQTLSSLYGVVVDEGDLSYQSAAGTSVEVAKDGIVTTLLSSASGNINRGDPITIKSIAGVGEKAAGNLTILGFAQDDLNAETPGSTQFELKQGDEQRSVLIAAIPVKIAIGEAGTGSNAASDNRNKLQQLADNLAGKTVKPWALIVAVTVFVLGIFASVFLISSSGYGSMISIGRNPLSESRIILFFMRLLTVAVAIFGLSLTLAYGILKIFG